MDLSIDFCFNHPLIPWLETLVVVKTSQMSVNSWLQSPRATACVPTCVCFCLQHFKVKQQNRNWKLYGISFLMLSSMRMPLPYLSPQEGAPCVWGLRGSSFWSSVVVRRRQEWGRSTPGMPPTSLPTLTTVHAWGCLCLLLKSTLCLPVLTSILSVPVCKAFRIPRPTQEPHPQGPMKWATHQACRGPIPSVCVFSTEL